MTARPRTQEFDHYADTAPPRQYGALVCDHRITGHRAATDEELALMTPHQRWWYMETTIPCAIFPANPTPQIGWETPRGRFIFQDLQGSGWAFMPYLAKFGGEVLRHPSRAQTFFTVHTRCGGCRAVLQIHCSRCRAVAFEDLHHDCPARRRDN